MSQTQELGWEISTKNDVHGNFEFAFFQVVDLFAEVLDGLVGVI